jgi:hypothetical protein
MVSSLASSFDVEQQNSAATPATKKGRHAFVLGVITGSLACALLAAIALSQKRTTSAFPPTAQVNAALEPMKTGVHDWEWKNVQRYRAGELNDAELGMANLKKAMTDQSMLKEVAQWLRKSEGRHQLIKMVVDPKFQAQAKNAAEHLKQNGELPNLFQLENYADIVQPRTKTAAPVGEATAAFNLPSVGNRDHAGSRASAPVAEVSAAAMDDLKKTARNAFPVGFFDPLKLSEAEFFDWGSDATIGFLRHSEIKHGRIAMAGFIGYCIHENGIHFPWKIYAEQDWSTYEGLSAPAVWDALPVESKYQIVGVIGFLEFWSESRYVIEEDGEKHYMEGGKPGFFPSFKKMVHPVPLNLFDPFGYAKKLSAQTKATKLSAEINNGRLAMIGLMSLLVESKIPGAVPFLDGLVKPYDGEVMKPF